MTWLRPYLNHNRASIKHPRTSTNAKLEIASKGFDSLDVDLLLRLGGLLPISDLRSGSVQPGLLLLLGLGPVLVQEPEELDGGVLVEGVTELGDCWGDLQTLVEDDLLSLESDVFRPFDESGDVSGRLDVLA